MNNGRLTHLFGHLLTGKFTVKSVTELADGRRVRVCIAAPTQKHPRDVMERLLANKHNAHIDYWLAEYSDSDYTFGTYFVFVRKS